MCVWNYLERKRGYKVFDSIDLQCEVLPLSFEELSKAAPGESSATIRERVVKARHIQEQRFTGVPGIHCNAQMSEAQQRQFVVKQTIYLFT